MGIGYCRTLSSSGQDSQTPPALSKQGASLPELRAWCEIMTGCIAIDENPDPSDTGTLRHGRLNFISLSAAIAALAEHGSSGFESYTVPEYFDDTSDNIPCETDCQVTDVTWEQGGGYHYDGRCWVKIPGS